MGHKEINIGTIAGLLGALDDPDMRIRTGTLQAIASQPEKAASLAVKGGLDLFRELSMRCEAPREAHLRAYYIQALLRLDDDRVDNLAREIFLTAKDTDLILLTAQRLAALSEGELISFLGPIALSPDDPTRGRAAANLLVRCRDLPPRLAIRVSVLADRSFDIPPLDDGNLDDWLEELQGSYPRRTRKLLREKQDGSFAALMTRWERLPAAVQLWVLREAAAADPAKAGPLFCKVLAQETNDKLLLETLKACPQLDSEAVKEELIVPYQHHKNPLLRAAAVWAGRGALGWVDMLENEKAPEVKIALIARLGEDKRVDSLRQLAACLEDLNWRVRAAATAALVTLAPASVPLLQKSFNHGTLHVRTAAGQALRQLGMDEWLAARMTADQEGLLFELKIKAVDKLLSSGI